LAWELSNTLDAAFCARAVRRAITAHRVPEIFNTDQGRQFASAELTQPLLVLGVRLPMDGKGRCLDNVLVERLWRSLLFAATAITLIPLRPGFPPVRLASPSRLRCAPNSVAYSGRGCPAVFCHHGPFCFGFDPERDSAATISLRIELLMQRRPDYSSQLSGRNPDMRDRAPESAISRMVRELFRLKEKLSITAQASYASDKVQIGRKVMWPKKRYDRCQ
jgi:transposase InsO family protein